jgi:hypothetical protein
VTGKKSPLKITVENKNSHVDSACRGMASKRASKQQQQLNVDQFKLLVDDDIKETIEKRSYCTGAQAIQLLYDLKENFCDPDAGLIVRDFPSTLSIQDRELRNDKSTFTTKDLDYLCSAVTVRSISPQLPSSPWVIYRGSAARSLSP